MQDAKHDDVRSDDLVFQRVGDDGFPHERVNKEALYNDTITHLEHKGTLLWIILIVCALFFLGVLL